MNDRVYEHGFAGSPLLHAVFALADTARARMEEAMAEVGLSMARYGVLDVLVRASDPLPLSELANRISCVRSNVTQLVDRLEADGLVRRIDDPTDRRSKLAEITPEGRARHAVAADRHRQVTLSFDNAVSESDREIARRILEAIR
ncbi:MAG TPA: MarR family transcriptional regulator [Longimicrobiales bacterium]|nr:MarR family transcriptional regulator [Longimicrobiales bacterium]